MIRYLLAASAFVFLGGVVATATAPQLDPKQAAELKAKLDKLTVDVQKATADAKKADEEAKVAADELAKLVEAGKLGKINGAVLEQLKVKAGETQAAAEVAKTKVKDLETAIAEIKAKLKPVPPPAPTAPEADAKVIAELKEKLAKVTTEAEKATAEAKKAADAAKVAADEHAKIVEVAMRGRVLPGTIEKAEAKAKEAQAAADAAKKKATELDATVAELKAKIKALEK